MKKPACVGCQRFFKIKRNGVLIEEGMPFPTGETQADQPKEGWRPYKLYVGDLWECERCGTQLALGNSQAVCEHYMPNYDTIKTRYRDRGLLLPMVEDC